MDRRLPSWTALPLLVAWTGVAHAAEPVAEAAAQPVAATVPADPAATGSIDFSADQVSYDEASELVVAAGRVRMDRDGYYLAADKVEWNRRSGEVVAIGNVVVLSPEGDRIIGDHVVLDDSLRDATVDNLLVVLESGGRLAARRATRVNGTLTLNQAIYTPCPVTTVAGCPKNPSWSISAARVTRDPVRGRLRFEGGRLTVLGITLPLIPVFNVSDGINNQAASGLLMPQFSLSSSNGVEISLPYYLRMGSNKDLTITPHAFLKALPAIEARWRHLTSIGAYQLGGFVTYGKIDRIDQIVLKNSSDDRHSIRG